MSQKAQQRKLPEGYVLKGSLTFFGKRWEVIEMRTGRLVTQNQRSHVLAVDREIESIKEKKT